jgi:O-antigen biosynthesis protein WbqP
MRPFSILKMKAASSYPFSARKRVFDVFVVMLALVFLFVPLVILALCIKLTSTGPIFFRSNRIGRDNVIFSMLKFRTMRVGAPVVATDKLVSPTHWITPLGGFMRRSSLDELPQLINVLRGDMSIIGPRPALYNQDDLIKERTARGVHLLRPGISGIAQISGRDELSINSKVIADAEYLSVAGFWTDFRIILVSARQIFVPRGVHH